MAQEGQPSQGPQQYVVHLCTDLQAWIRSFKVLPAMGWFPNKTTQLMDFFPHLWDASCANRHRKPLTDKAYRF